MSCRTSLHGFAAVSLLFAALALAGCSGPVRTPAGNVSTGGAEGDPLGVIAFVNTQGCIERVFAASGESAGEPFCASDRAKITAITWMDADSLAFGTNEGRALGWQLLRVSTGLAEAMPIAEAPRVLLIPPQFYSSRNERLDIDAKGVVSRVDEVENVRIFPPEGRDPDTSTRLVAWSPDGQWVLLAATTSKDLWVVGRDGSNPHRVASASRGVASWYMPAVGATPHADLTCSVVTEQSYGCAVPLRQPSDGATIIGTPGETADFGWSACPGATGYVFELYAEGSNTPLYSTIVVGTFLHRPLDTLPDSRVRWRVRALIGTLAAPWSEERTFSVTPVAAR